MWILYVAIALIVIALLVRLRLISTVLIAIVSTGLFAKLGALIGKLLSADPETAKLIGLCVGVAIAFLMFLSMIVKPNAVRELMADNEKEAEEQQKIPYRRNGMVGMLVLAVWLAFVYMVKTGIIVIE